MIGAGAAGDHRAGPASASATARVISSSASGQPRPMPRWAVSMASATARPRSHRWWRKRERLFPVDRRRQPGIVVGEGIGDHMGGGESDAREFGRIATFDPDRFASHSVGFDPPVGGGQPDFGHHISSAGTSSQRRSFQLCRPSSASCTPLAPSTEVVFPWAVLGDVAQEQLPLLLEAVVGGPVVRHLLPGPKKSIVCGMSGFQTGFGVLTRCWVKHLVSPATAEPCVPSTWKVTRSSRRTLVVQDELIWAMTPPSSSKVA